MQEEDGEIQKVATLAATCTKLKGEDRPTMREVEMALESLLVKKRTPTRNRGDETTAHYMSSTSTSSRYYTCNLFFLFCLISMFNLSRVRVVLTLVAMIYMCLV
jgi:hypothetical protein